MAEKSGREGEVLALASYVEASEAVGEEGEEDNSVVGEEGGRHRCSSCGLCGDGVGDGVSCGESISPIVL